MHDAVRLFSSALRDYSVFRDVETTPADCTSPSRWSSGEALLKTFDAVSVSKNKSFNYDNLLSARNLYIDRLM